MTRILKIIAKGDTWFVPQHQIAMGKWVEFIGCDKDSPYLHPKCFPNEDEARAFLLSPGIYSEGDNGKGIYGKVISDLRGSPEPPFVPEPRNSLQQT